MQSQRGKASISRCGGADALRATYWITKQGVFLDSHCMTVTVIQGPGSLCGDMVSRNNDDCTSLPTHQEVRTEFAPSFQDPGGLLYVLSRWKCSVSC